MTTHALPLRLLPLLLAAAALTLAASLSPRAARAQSGDEAESATMAPSLLLVDAAEASATPGAAIEPVRTTASGYTFRDVRVAALWSLFEARRADDLARPVFRAGVERLGQLHFGDAFAYYALLPYDPYRVPPVPPARFERAFAAFLRTRTLLFNPSPFGLINQNVGRYYYAHLGYGRSLYGTFHPVLRRRGFFHAANFHPAFLHLRLLPPGLFPLGFFHTGFFHPAFFGAPGGHPAFGPSPRGWVAGPAGTPASSPPALPTTTTPTATTPTATAPTTPDRVPTAASPDRTPAALDLADAGRRRDAQAEGEATREREATREERTARPLRLQRLAPAPSLAPEPVEHLIPKRIPLRPDPFAGRSFRRSWSRAGYNPSRRGARSHTARRRAPRRRRATSRRGGRSTVRRAAPASRRRAPARKGGG
jgi:hypothetical protein